MRNANGTVLAVNDAVTVDTTDQTTVGVDVSGGGAGDTVAFEATVNGSTWRAIAAQPLVGGATVTTATAAGGWYITCRGMSGVRVRKSVGTTDNYTVVLRSGIT